MDAIVIFVCGVCVEQYMNSRYRGTHMDIAAAIPLLLCVVHMLCARTFLIVQISDVSKSGVYGSVYVYVHLYLCVCLGFKLLSREGTKANISRRTSVRDRGLEPDHTQECNIKGNREPNRELWTHGHDAATDLFSYSCVFYRMFNTLSVLPSTSRITTRLMVV